MDNEGKRGNIGKSGIPNDCPGKFPSPWTPGTQLQLEPGSDKRPRTKLTEALLDARTTTQPKSGQKPKARDDSDITIDLGAPRSESGKYWKEQYESYAERSEKEMKKVIAKQQLAKKFAMKKDGEVTELATKLEQERRKFRQRERELELQNKDFQDQLQQAVASNASANIEVASLKARIAVLERSVAMSSSEVQHCKPSFDIYEDLSKDAVAAPPGETQAADVSIAPSLSMASSGKENYSPESLPHRRQSVARNSTRPAASSRLSTTEGDVSIILGKSPRTMAIPAQAQPEPAIPTSDTLSKSPQIERGFSKENNAPKSPTAIPPSSPLPVPSPGLDDPWLALNHESSIAPMDKMALPISSGEPYTRASWNPPPKQHRNSKSISQAKTVQQPGQNRRAEKVDTGSYNFDQQERGFKLEPEVEVTKASKRAAPDVSTDVKFDVSKVAACRAEGPINAKQGRAETQPIDRKEEARRRLEERKRLRKATCS